MGQLYELTAEQDATLGVLTIEGTNQGSTVDIFFTRQQD